MKKRFMTDKRREFYRDKDNQPFELVTVSNPEGNADVMLYTVRQLFGDEDLISYVQSDFEKHSRLAPRPVCLRRKTMRNTTKCYSVLVLGMFARSVAGI